MTAGFIVTASGHELDMAYPRPGHICAWDIAWSLAQINRFNGHAIRPYSVAEHSLLVCEIAEVELGLNVHGQLAALMHDAHEAYTGDMHTPGKVSIGKAWYEFEGQWERMVRNSFALHTAFVTHHIQIKRADLMALATERKALISDQSASRWACLEGIEPVPWVDLREPWRLKADWEFWRDRWLDKYHELDTARTELHWPAEGVNAKGTP